MLYLGIDQHKRQLTVNLRTEEPTERSKQKTDRRDAGELSHLLWVHRQQFLEGKHPLGLRRVQPPTTQQADDRQLTALRARVLKKRTAVLNGIHKIPVSTTWSKPSRPKDFRPKKSAVGWPNWSCRRWTAWR